MCLVRQLVARVDGRSVPPDVAVPGSIVVSLLFICACPGRRVSLFWCVHACSALTVSQLAARCPAASFQSDRAAREAPQGFGFDRELGSPTVTGLVTTSDSERKRCQHSNAGYRATLGTTTWLRERVMRDTVHSAPE